MVTNSGYISLSKDKMHSNYDSVQQQTGFFAGKDGFGIKTGEHTQLDTAVIGSTASAEKNRLETGRSAGAGLTIKPNSRWSTAAVSEGGLPLRDTAKQMQDITTLSRDVGQANNALSPIFNKEKEQKRLKQAQLIGEIGAQVMDIVRTIVPLDFRNLAPANQQRILEYLNTLPASKKNQIVIMR
ncbi:hypothetical protein E2566_11460 [Pectobacterium punjabense]|uniref:CdiA C-terminal tRNase domain-containing protein n=1 Tax=Pectobacterium punjabense TaxID=2108399 RepID=A0ABX6L2F8_9GAMM|nr:hypothetical protein [Pectobacterium punjabense]PTA63917.1 hypothetical protein C9I36_12545 [Pectobacterium punjabense]QJA20501.1 hypothetical protein E2566_11460 [Pectobacterium punjabense]